uniref:Uncharacterized protein n=1 Tax=Knipowitschia caucasica TaxID=637954 RepID=A0AAV2LJL7_KNICA
MDSIQAVARQRNSATLFKKSSALFSLPSFPWLQHGGQRISATADKKVPRAIVFGLSLDSHSKPFCEVQPHAQTQKACEWEGLVAARRQEALVNHDRGSNPGFPEDNSPFVRHHTWTDYTDERLFQAIAEASHPILSC